MNLSGERRGSHRHVRDGEARRGPGAGDRRAQVQGRG